MKYVNALINANLHVCVVNRDKRQEKQSNETDIGQNAPAN